MTSHHHKMISMRTHFFAWIVLAACSNDVGPRMITGGGVGDGSIDGRLNIYIIDNITYAPLPGAMVAIGTKTATTDATGLVTFNDLSGAQTVAVKADGYRMTVWQGANGANMTIPLTASTTTPDSATLSGAITGWDTITVPTGHTKAGLVTYSQTDDLGNAANNLQTPGMGNICTGIATCNWTLVSRTGEVSVVAILVDRDNAKGTFTIIGYATKSALTVDKGVNQSGLALALVQTGDLQNVSIDLGTAPAGLTMTSAIVGIEVAKNEVVQLPF